MLFNLDTSDGHVMWWGLHLWTDSNTYGDVQTPIEDHKSEAFLSLDEGSNILLVVHQNGQYVGNDLKKKAVRAHCSAISLNRTIPTRLLCG